MLTYTWLTASDEMVKQCYALREEVFVREQGFREEFDDVDVTAHHLLVTEQGAPVAAARIFPDEAGSLRQSVSAGSWAENGLRSVRSSVPLGFMRPAVFAGWERSFWMNTAPTL